MNNKLLRSLPEFQRIAIANDAVNAVHAGKPEKTVAEMYGTTTVTLHRWLKQADRIGNVNYKKKGRPTIDPSHVYVHNKIYEIDLRQLTPAQRDSIRHAAVEKIQMGERIDVTSHLFAVSPHTLHRWVQDEETQRGKKQKQKQKHPNKYHSNLIRIFNSTGRVHHNALSA